MNRFNAYIDESGDEGFNWLPDGRGSTGWFFAGAVVVPAPLDLSVSAVIDRIKSRLNLPEPQDRSIGLTVADISSESTSSRRLPESPSPLC
ncbi:MAG: hypothetical protein ACYC9Q_14370 [Bacillota bacterium]